MSAKRKGYKDIESALAMSPSGLAERLHRLRPVLAMRTAAGIRIVKSYTDPTVVRKLNDKDRASEWFPVRKADF